MPRYYRDVDLRMLRVPPSRMQGADPGKLQWQIATFGRSAVGMPPPEVYECSNGDFVIWNGVTRATRIAKLAPGQRITVEVIGPYGRKYSHLPRVEDVLP